MEILQDSGFGIQDSGFRIRDSEVGRQESGVGNPTRPSPGDEGRVS